MLLQAEAEARSARWGAPPRHWTDAQRSLFVSDYRLTVWWGANGIGKSLALAELARRAIAGRLHWQRPGPQTVILCGNTWGQLGSTLRYLWSGVDKRWFRPGVRYESGGMKGQRLQVFEVVDGPGKGGELRLGTFRAANLAGPRADAVITDEPLPEDVHDELWARLLGRNGRMYQTFTPTLGTCEDLDYLWAMVDNYEIPWAGQIQTELTIDNVTPRGGICPMPWMTEREIKENEEGYSKLQADMRMGRSRNPMSGVAYFNLFGPHLIGECIVPPGTLVGVGIDHGSKPGAQRAVLVAVGGLGLLSHCWVLDEYKGDGRTRTEEDAAGILAMLERNGLRLRDVDRWIGDRAHGGDWRGARKSNTRLLRAIAEAVGHEVNSRGWHAKLPQALARIRTPKKFDRSHWEGCEILHRLMAGEKPRVTFSPRVAHLVEDLSKWAGSKYDPHKDGIDAWRYIAVPMVEGRDH